MKFSKVYLVGIAQSDRAWRRPGLTAPATPGELASAILWVADALAPVRAYSLTVRLLRFAGIKARGTGARRLRLPGG